MDYSLLFRKHKVVKLLIDSDTGQIRDANDAAIQFYGYSHDKITSMHIQDIYIVDGAEDKLPWQNMSDEQSFFENWHRLASGEIKKVYVWSTQIDITDSPISQWVILASTQRQNAKLNDSAPFEQSNDAILDQTEPLTDVMDSQNDIVTLIESREALKHSEARFRAVVDSMDDIVFTLDTSQRHTGVYGKWLRKNQLTSDFFLGRSAREMFGEQSARVHEPANLKALSGDNIRYEWQSQSPTGETTFYETHLSPIFEDDKVTGIVGIGRDITQQKRNEQIIKEKKEELERFFAVVADMMTIMDRDATLIRVNDAWEKTLGYPEHLLKGKQLSDLVHSEDQDATLTMLTELRQNEPISGFTNRCVDQDGRYRLLQWSAQLSGDLIYATARDITEQKRLEEHAFAYALEKERVDILTRFIRDASHEFRTPLSIIQSSLYIFEKTNSSEKRQEKVTAIQNQVERLTQLLENLVLMSKLDSGIALELHQEDLLALLLHQLSDLQPDISIKNLSVTVDAADNPIIPVDTHYIREAIKHVLHNAVRYTPINGQIVVRFIIKEDTVVLDIENSGDGISDEVLPHIFDRFYRHDEAHTTPGIGLGLSIAHSIIERHGGSIQAENLVDHKVRFRITLPISQ